jgi:hypothetical protein
MEPFKLLKALKPQVVGRKILNETYSMDARVEALDVSSLPHPSASAATWS